MALLECFTGDQTAVIVIRDDHHRTLHDMNKSYGLAKSDVVFSNSEDCLSLNSNHRI